VSERFLSLGQAVYKAISGRVTEPSRDPAADLREAQQRAGGVSQLARALGVDRTTIQRWNRAGEPSPAGAALIEAALRVARIPTGRQERMRSAERIVLYGVQEDRGERVIVLEDGRHLTPGLWSACLSAYFAGDGPIRLGEIAKDHVTDEWYRRMLDGMVPYPLKIRRVTT
jgi:hypothetical protein